MFIIRDRQVNRDCKAIIQGVVPHYIEHDLLEKGGKKIRELKSTIEFFDFEKQEKMGYLTSDRWIDLYTLLSVLHKKHRAMNEDGILLQMREQSGTCALSLFKQKSPLVKNELLFYKSFPEEEWANVEEELILMGLRMVKRSEYAMSLLHFRSAEIKIESTDESHNMTVTARNTEDLIETITVCGYSLDRAKMVNLPYHEQ